MKPINMKTWEVRAILDNRKAVARRVVKPKPLWQKPPIQQKRHLEYWGNWDDPNIYKAAYRPGDILYVRETWKQATCDYAGGGYGLTDLYLYKADEPVDATGMMVEEKWHPSIHMPREAARIFLRVTGVRVERLQEITFSGAIAEGIFWEDVTPDVPSMPDNPAWDMDAVIAEMQEREERELIEKSYGTLWNSNLKPAGRALYGWEANPWIFVISFERITKDEAMQ